MPRLGALFVLLGAVALMGALPERASAAQGSLLRSVFGSSMVRAEVIVQEGDTVRDLRVDRGKIRVLTSRRVKLLEIDGTLLTVPVAVNAAITTRGRRSSFDKLRTGMQVTTVRTSDEPAHYVLQPATTLPKELHDLLFGAQMIRAEVILKGRGGVRDIHIDAGEIVAVRPRVLRLRERDGRIVATKVATRAKITLDGRKAQWAWLRAGMVATVLRDGDGDATIVQASAAGAGTSAAAL